MLEFTAQSLLSVTQNGHKCIPIHFQSIEGPKYLPSPLICKFVAHLSGLPFLRTLSIGNSTKFDRLSECSLHDHTDCGLGLVDLHAQNRWNRHTLPSTAGARYSIDSNKLIVGSHTRTQSYIQKECKVTVNQR